MGPPAGEAPRGPAAPAWLACYKRSAVMFGLGFGEILIILVLALILLGPARLPEVAKQLGKGLRDFRKATDDLKGQFEREMYVDDRPRPKPALVQPPTAAEPVPASPPGPAP